MTNAQYKEHIKVLEDKLSRQSKANEEMTRALHHKNLQIIALSGVTKNAEILLKAEFNEDLLDIKLDSIRLAKRLNLEII